MPYRAKPGQEDRHGEMTGAISINMVMVMPLTCLWCMMIGPWFFDSVWVVVIAGLIIGVVLTVICLPLSQRIWAKISDKMDDSQY